MLPAIQKSPRPRSPDQRRWTAPLSTPSRKRLARRANRLASSWNRKRVVRRFADPRTQITIPSSRIPAVHYTRDEAQLLCHVAPVLPDVVSAGCGVLVHKLADPGGLDQAG